MIRPATLEDAQAVCHLIRQLAKYARMEHEVTLDERQLREHLFGPRPWAEALVAEEAGQIVGFALFFHNYSTFAGKPGLYLEDLFVEPEYRGRGYGKALFQSVVRLAAERGCGRMEWSVLDWNEPAIRFYRSLGAPALEEATIYRLAGESLARAAQ
ncbi:MAG TPA: GNAT family N-acetyltransferase [Pirellulales bacterium]|nr:GNAT family N-acetyltransferase [Pirellulales bacterium]